MIKVLCISRITNENGIMAVIIFTYIGMYVFFLSIGICPRLLLHPCTDISMNKRGEVSCKNNAFAGNDNTLNKIH